MRGWITRVVRGEGLEGSGGFELKKMEIREGRRRAKQGGREICGERGERDQRTSESENRTTNRRGKRDSNKNSRECHLCEKEKMESKWD